MQLPLQGFGSHVVSRPRYLLVVGVHAYRSAKVDNFDVVVTLSVVVIQKHYIVQFDIAMHDPPLMQIRQSAQQLLGNPHHQQLRKLLQSFNQIDHRPAPAELHHNVVVRFVIKYLIQLNDVGMIQLREQTELG